MGELNTKGTLLNDSADQRQTACVQTVILVDEEIDFEPRDGAIWLPEPESEEFLVLDENNFLILTSGQHIGGLAVWPATRTHRPGRALRMVPTQWAFHASSPCSLQSSREDRLSHPSKTSSASFGAITLDSIKAVAKLSTDCPGGHHFPPSKFNFRPYHHQRR